MRTDENIFYFELSCTLPSYSVPFSDSDESSFLDDYILLCSDHHFELGKKIAGTADCFSFIANAHHVFRADVFRNALIRKLASDQNLIPKGLHILPSK